MTPILELRGITKQFPGVLANDHINLTLEKGEIHALLGENGAGKSTLMNILYGLYQPTEGEIYVGGEKIEVHSPSDSIHAGVGMVHQHFMLVPVFTVAENVMLGEEQPSLADFLTAQKQLQKFYKYPSSITWPSTLIAMFVICQLVSSSGLRSSSYFTGKRIY